MELREANELLMHSTEWTLTHSFVVLAIWKLKSVIKASISFNELLTSSRGSSEVRVVLSMVTI